MGERDLMLPRGAQAILEARCGGLKPAEAVVVSYVGDTGWPNPHVYADSGVAYDWSWAKDLDVVIVVKPGVDAEDAIRGISDPFRDPALSLPSLVDIEREELACILPGPVLWAVKRGTQMWREVFA